MKRIFSQAWMLFFILLVLPFMSAELLVFEDFEDNNFHDTFAWEGDGTCSSENSGTNALSIVEVNSRHGTRSLRYDMCSETLDPLTGVPGCGRVHLNIGKWRLDPVSGTTHVINESIYESKQLFVRYHLFYEVDNDPVKDYMWPFYLTVGSWAASTGHVDFVAETQSGFALASTIRTIGPGQFGGWQSTIHPNELDMVFLRDGQWHKMEFFVDYDSLSDGTNQSLVRAWVDDVLVYENTDAGLRGIPDFVQLHKTLSPGGFYNNCTSSIVQIDDVELWSSLPGLGVCADGLISDYCECGGASRNSGFCLSGDVWHPSELPTCIPSPEVCDDGVDNSCNGLVDDQDPACPSLGLDCSYAHINISSENNYVLLVNGRYIGHGGNLSIVDRYTVPLRENNNSVAVKSFNKVDPTFVFVEAQMCGAVMTSDADWKATLTKPYGWLNPDTDTSAWSGAVELAELAPAGFVHEPVAITSPYDMAQGQWDVAWLRTRLQAEMTPSPIIHSSSLIPSGFVYVGGNITLLVNASNYDSLGAVITVSGVAFDVVALESNVEENYTIVHEGLHLVDFVASMVGQVSAFVNYSLMSFEPVLFTTSITNHSHAPMNATTEVFYNGSLLVQSTAEQFSEIVPRTSLNLSMNTTSFKVVFSEFDVFESSNKNLSVDYLTAVDDVIGGSVFSEGYEYAYAQLRIYYGDFDVVDEDLLSVVVCNQWNYTGRNCVGSWEEPVDVVQDKNSDEFIINTTNITGAYAVVQDEPITPPQDDSPSGGGPSRGSGPSSQQPQQTDRHAYYLGQVFAGEQHEVLIDSQSIDIVRVLLVFKDTDTITMRLEQKAMREVPYFMDNFYQAVNISIQGGSDSVQRAYITFRVPNWYHDSFDSAQFSLYRYTDSWDLLPTSFLRTDENYTYYEAQSTGLSYFLIGSQEIVSEEDFVEPESAGIDEFEDPSVEQPGQDIADVGSGERRTYAVEWRVPFIIAGLILVMIIIIHMYKKKMMKNVKKKVKGK